MNTINDHARFLPVYPNLSLSARNVKRRYLVGTLFNSFYNNYNILIAKLIHPQNNTKAHP